MRRAVAAFLLAVVSVSEGWADPAGRILSLQTDEVTWANVALSPDGGQLVFDLLGDLYELPIGGGIAKRLYANAGWTTAPAVSPDGRRIAFLSDAAGGARDVWVANRDGSAAQRVFEGVLNTLSFAWTADSQTIVLARPLPEQYTVLTAVRIADGHREELSPQIRSVSGLAIARRGSTLYFASPPAGADSYHPQIFARDASGAVSQVTADGDPAFRPEVSDDGTLLAFVRRHGGVTALWLKDLHAHLERKLLEPFARDDLTNQTAITGDLAEPLPAFAFSPDGAFIFTALNGKIVRVATDTGAVDFVPFLASVEKRLAPPLQLSTSIGATFEPKELLWTNVARDRRRVVFTAAGNAWVWERRQQRARRLTASPGLEYEPVLSPDGRHVAYISRSDSGSRLMIVDLNGGTPRQVAASRCTLEHPAWSPDGSKLAFVAPVLGEDATNPVNRGCGGRERTMAVQWVALAYGTVHTVTTYTASPQFYMLSYSPLIFRSDGAAILFTRQVQQELRVESIGMEGGSPSTKATFDGGIEFVVPAPDGRTLAVGGENGVWISRPGQRRFDEMTKITSDAASYANWIDAGTLAWTQTNNLRFWSARGAVTRPERLAFTIPRFTPSGVLAFTHARLVTMDKDDVIESGTLIVKDNRIAALGPTDRTPVPPQARVIDLHGATVMPGLIDTHAHPNLRPSREGQYYLEYNLPYLACLAYGVTTAFDPQTQTRDVFAQAEMVQAGTLVGPRMYSTGDALFGLRTNTPMTLDAREQVRREVQKRAEAGALMIKSYLLSRREQRQWVIDEARAFGLGVTTEGGGQYDNELTHIVDGHTAIEHELPVSPLYRDVVSLIARSGVTYTPVLPALMHSPGNGDFFLTRADEDWNAKLRRFTHPKEMQGIQTRTPLLPDAEYSFFAAARSAAEIVRAGGNVSIGSHGERTGLGAHWDMWMLAMGGFTPMEALRAATVSGARKLGLEAELGSLSVGKLADLIVLNGNPLDDIRHTADIRYVVANGVVYDAESMTELYPHYRILPRPYWQSQEDWDRMQVIAPPPLQ